MENIGEKTSADSKSVRERFVSSPEGEMTSPKKYSSLAGIIEELKQHEAEEELERAAASYHEKRRREREGTPPNYQAYYEASSGVYYIPDASGNWTQVNESGIKQYLMIVKGIDSKRNKKGYSPLDQALHDLHTHFYVGYAGKLAGHRPGLYWQNGEQILVTKGPTLIEPAPGDFPIITQLLNHLLGAKQRIYFDCWLKIGAEALRTGKFRPGQALVLAGPKDCGKSFVQNHVITPLLGGRKAKPFQHFSGATNFNGDLLEAEHLVIEDEIANIDEWARRNFGTKIKQITANEGQICHAKYKQALTLHPFWRISISCNDEPENMVILPSMDRSLSDKITILKATKAPMPMPTQTGEDRQIFCETIESELPRYLHHLLHLAIPSDLKCDRFGVKAYQNPELMDQLNELNPESHFFEAIEACRPYNNEKGFWKGSAVQFMVEIGIGLGSHLRGILNSPKSCGIYLSRLAEKFPTRIQRTKSKGHAYYTIFAPEGFQRGSVVT